jgi:S-adenosylmethionine decarboxylase
MKDGSSGLRLHGFNNLTKALSFNIYDVCYARTAEARRQYLEYIDDQYSAAKLTQILHQVANMIGATVLNVARQDYDPQGASVAMLISEQPLSEGAGGPGTTLAHLDKSHITVHTYPETHPVSGVATFRADIDVATCGLISPLKALDFLIDSFESDIVIIDYHVRGFTRDVDGHKHYIDHRIASIQQYLAPRIRSMYDMIDVNVPRENIFHTKMKVHDFDIERHLFGSEAGSLEPKVRRQVETLLQQEIHELYYGKNLR